MSGLPLRLCQSGVCSGKLRRRELIVQDVSLGSHYPTSWAEYIGQSAIKKRLQIAAAAARSRNRPMGHLMIKSPMPGVGKTALAQLVAAELGGRMHVRTEPVKPAQVPFMLMDVKDGDVLFLDEAHRLVAGGKNNAEWLLALMENGIISSPLGVEQAPKITIIAASTDAARLPKTIRDRFELQATLTGYTDEEGTQLAVQLAGKILAPDDLPIPDAPTAAAVARAGNNVPRLIRRILCAVRDLALTGEIEPQGGTYPLAPAFEFAEVTADGLTQQALEYLRVLMVDFKGNPAGQKVLADRLGEVGTGLKEIEDLLLGKELIALTKTGRMLTTDGMRRAREVMTS